MKQMINEVTSAIMANGMWRYQERLGQWIENRHAKVLLNQKYDEEYEEGFEAITIEQMKFPVIILLIGLAISLLVFIIEVIVCKVKQQRRQQ